MGKQRKPVQFDAYFKNAEQKRLRLIKVQKSMDLDVPCQISLISPEQIRDVVQMEEEQLQTLTEWLSLIESGFKSALAKAAASERQTSNAALDSVLTLDAFIEQHTEGVGHLRDFAVRLFNLDTQQRFAGTEVMQGAPHNSELPVFAPARRGLKQGVDGPAPRPNQCKPKDHAAIIWQALAAIGPSASVTRIGQSDLTRALVFEPLWCLATDHWMPYLWLGKKNPQEYLQSLYINDCFDVVRNEHGCWVSKEPGVLTEDNLILKWLCEPNEPNRLRALNFAHRHTLTNRPEGAPGTAAQPGELVQDDMKNSGGRPCLSESEAQRRIDLVERWRNAKDAGVAQRDFCRDEGIKLRDLTKFINWCAHRRRRSNEP